GAEEGGDLVGGEEAGDGDLVAGAAAEAVEGERVLAPEVGVAGGAAGGDEDLVAAAAAAAAGALLAGGAAGVQRGLDGEGQRGVAVAQGDHAGARGAEESPEPVHAPG